MASPARIVAFLTSMLAALSFLALAGCPGGGDLEEVDLSEVLETGTPARERSSGEVLRFGFDPRLDPVEEARIYNPFLDFLEAKTGRRFEMRFTKRNETIVGNLGSGVVHFGAIGSVSFVKANRLHGARCIARGRNLKGDAEYQAAVVTRPDSPLRELGQLRGKAFAFGDENSTQGHLLPRTMLLAAGIGLDDLNGHFFTGSHQKCADAVVARRADAGGMQDTLAFDLESKGLIRILALSPPFPSSGICAGRDVDAGAVEAVRKALLEFDPAGRDRPLLYHWERTEMPLGFVEAKPEDYRIVVDVMTRLGMI